MKFTVALIFLISSIFTFAQQELKLNLRIGDAFSQHLDVKSIVDQDLDLGQFSINVDISMDLLYEVNAIESGVFVLDMEYEQIKMTTNLAGNEVTYDSESISEDPYNLAFRAICNNKFKLYLTSDGSVEKVTGMNAVFAKIMNEFPDLTEQKRQELLQVIQKSYGEDALRKNLEASMRIFPRDPVSVGDTWKIKSKLDTGGTKTTKYTFLGKADGKFKIKGVSNFSIDIDSRTNPTLKSMKMKGTMTQFIFLDKKNGWVLESKAKQEMKGPVVYSKSAQIPDGMHGTMFVSSIINITSY